MTVDPASDTPNPPALVPAIVWQLLALAWACAILWLSLVPSPPQPPDFLLWDKLQHAGAYGLLALLLACCLRSWLKLTAPAACLVAWVSALFFGALLEILQLLGGAGRSAEWGDLAADAVGAALACVVFRLASALRSRRYQALEKPHG